MDQGEGQHGGGVETSATDTIVTASSQPVDLEAWGQETGAGFSSKATSPSSPGPVVEAEAPVARVKARQDDSRYYMEHERRGVALIFNHETFQLPELERRYGTDKDCESLTSSLQALGFTVRVYKDLEYAAIQDFLAEVAAEDHSESDCLLVAVMTHGRREEIFASDRAYRTSQLWTRFVGKACPTLIGKPKLFFIQACRGRAVDDGNKVVCDSVDACAFPTATSGDDDDTYYIPDEADVLVMYSTCEGYYSWKNSEGGSWFIQALCKELDENAYGADLFKMLTAVSRRVALHRRSNYPKDPVMDQTVQMPELYSKLTREVYFTRKENTPPGGS